MSDHLEDQYQRIKLAIDSLRAASIGNTPTAEEIRAAQKKADSKPDTTVDEVLQEAGFSTKGERQAEVATIKEIKQWAEEILTRIRHQWVSAGNEWTTEMGEEEAVAIAEYLLAVKGDDRFDPRNPFVSSQTAVRQLTLNTIIAESEFGRAVPGALTFRVRKREITAGMVGQGLITDAERRAIRGETGFPEHNDFALQFNKQMAFQMPEFMNEATGVVRFRGGLGAIPGQGKLSALTQNVIERFSEEDIAAGALPLPPVVTDRYKPDPLKGGRDQITALLTTESGVLKKGVVEDAVKEALLGQGFSLERDNHKSYPRGQDGQDLFDAVEEARNAIVDSIRVAASSLRNEADKEGRAIQPDVLAASLADLLLSQTGKEVFEADRHERFTQIQVAREDTKATTAADTAATNPQKALTHVLKTIGDLYRDDISTADQRELETRIANGDLEGVKADLRNEGFVNGLIGSKVLETRKKRQAMKSVGDTAFADAIHAVGDWNGEGRLSIEDFFEDDLPDLYSSFLETGELPIREMLASRQRQLDAEAEKVRVEKEEDQIAAGITAVKPTEIERTLQNLGVGRVGAQTDYQKYLLDTVVPHISATMEDVRRIDPTASLEGVVEQLIGLPEDPKEFVPPTQRIDRAINPVTGTFENAPAGDLRNPLLVAEEAIASQRATPLYGTPFETEREFDRRQVQVDPRRLPGQEPEENVALGLIGQRAGSDIAPLPTLDDTGVGRDRPPGLDIPENPELMALIAEIAEGDTDFQNYLIGQIPSLIDELGKQAVSERQRREKEAFAKYGFTVDSEGKETAPAGNLLDMSPQQRSRLITTETMPEYRFGPDRGDLPESQQLEPLIRSRRQNLLLDFRNTPTYLARQRRDQERGQELASLETERIRGRALRRGTSRFVSTRV